MNVLSTGLAYCVLEPLGAFNLGDYVLGHHYQYAQIQDSKTNEVYYQILPHTMCSEHWDRCAPLIFHKYFQEV